MLIIHKRTATGKIYKNAKAFCFPCSFYDPKIKFLDLSRNTKPLISFTGNDFMKLKMSNSEMFYPWTSLRGFHDTFENCHDPESFVVYDLPVVEDEKLDAMDIMSDGSSRSERLFKISSAPVYCSFHPSESDKKNLKQKGNLISIEKQKNLPQSI